MNKLISTASGLKNNPWLILIVTGMGVILSTLDIGIVNIALPIINEQFTSSNLLLSQWIISSYLFMVCITLPLWGKLGDLYSRNSLYLIGFIIFTITSFLCTQSSSIEQLILFRCLQGCGGAMIMANNQAIIVDIVPQKKHGLALGINAMFSSLGSIAGPGLGGLIITLFDWRGIFYINIPIGIIGCIAGYIILPKIKKKITNKIDYIGALLFAIGMFSFLMFLTHLGEENISAKNIAIYSVVGLFSWIMFYIWEKRIACPILDFKLFNNKIFSSSVFLAFVTFAAVGVNTILLPFYLQNQMHLSPAASGLIMLITPLFMMVLSPLSGHLSDKVARNKLTAIGLIIITLSLGYQFFLTNHVHLIHTIISQILFGIGSGIFQSPNNYTILSDVPKSHISTSSSIASLMRNTGRIFGTIMASVSFVIVQSYYAAKFDKITTFFYGFKAAFLVAIILLLIGIGIAWQNSRKF